MQGAYLTKRIQGNEEMEFYPLGIEPNGTIPRGYGLAKSTEIIGCPEGVTRDRLQGLVCDGKITDLTAVICHEKQVVLYPLNRINEVTVDLFLHMAVTTMESSGRQRTYMLFKKVPSVDVRGVYIGAKVVVMKASADTLSKQGKVCSLTTKASEVAQELFRDGVKLDEQGLHVQGHVFRAEVKSTEDEVGSPKLGAAVVNLGMIVHIDFSRVVGGVRTIQSKVFTERTHFVEVNRDVLADCFMGSEGVGNNDQEIQEDEEEFDLSAVGEGGQVDNVEEDEEEDFAVTKAFLNKYVGDYDPEYSDPRILQIVAHALNSIDEDCLPGSPNASVVRLYNKLWLLRQGAIRL